MFFNLFVPNAPFLYLLKTSENRMVFWCFQELEKGSIGNNWVNGHKSFCIPIFCHNKLISDFREKAELFNSFLANQCSLITNTCELPTICKSSTDKSLSNISFTDNDIGKIIKGLDPNKAHGHDIMSIRMPKL